MGLHRKIIGILTSSRADYGVYRPLLMELNSDNSFDLKLLVFGTHLSEEFGMTIKQIEGDGYNIGCKLNTLPEGDAPADISAAMARTISKFIPVWAQTHFDLIVALGDRYEMFAAVASTTPFNIPVAHIHGGETTLGTIDNSFRHAISCFSKLHFASTDVYKNRIKEITGSSRHLYNVGALSIDAIKQTKLLTLQEFKKKYRIDLSLPTILLTFHPETVYPERNNIYIRKLLAALDLLHHYQYIITMPNADTAGLMVRDEIKRWGENRHGVYLIESFGSTGYFTCLKHCSMMLGNSSSGFVEAFHFSKPVINLGERQKGRIITPNILTIPIEISKIIEAVGKVERMNKMRVKPIYGKGNTALKIMKILKKEFNIN